jgi:hypothetical protein
MSIPEVIRIVYGIPTHMLTTITVILAVNAFVRNGISDEIHRPGQGAVRYAGAGAPSVHQLYPIKTKMPSPGIKAKK